MKYAQRMLMFLAVTGCVQARPSVVSPPSLLDVLCEELAEEDGYRREPIYVVGETRPIYQSFALRFATLGDDTRPEDAVKDEKRDDLLYENFRSAPIRLWFADRRCKWKLDGLPFKNYAGTDVTVLELSSIIPSPVTLNGETVEVGRFARLTLGGSMIGTWYWIGGTGSEEQWKPRRAVLLPINDI